MNHIQYAKNVLDSHRLDDLKSLIKNHWREIPDYNFCRNTEDSENYMEEIIRELIGKEHHVEWWVRDTLEETLWHVDANELEEKIYNMKYGLIDPKIPKEFPLNTHVFYVEIDPKMEGGELLILPHNTYVEGRPIVDDSYKPIERQNLITIKPIENHMVIWDKPIYHATNRVKNPDIIKHRISFMFSSWDFIPKVYKDHKHWNSPLPFTWDWNDKYNVKAKEFKLTI